MALRKAPIRILTAVPICDGHDSAINTINSELVHHGVEVVYLGYHRGVGEIVRAAIQEDVRAVGISSYNGGHVEFFTQVVHLLRKHGAPHISVFGGGGGTITQDDAVLMQSRGVDRIFLAGTPLREITRYVLDRYAKSSRRSPPAGHRSMDVRISALLSSGHVARTHIGPNQRPRVVGIAGPGGAGKTTLIDELTLRYLRTFPAARMAILSHDPSIAGRGALLGDRAAMIHAQDDRVFMRSLATRGHAGGLSGQTLRYLEILRRVELDHGRGFGLILVETVGIGQESVPFSKHLVDQTILVMSPDYGSRLQLQKIAMFDAADVVVVNKADRPGARAAIAEIGERVGSNGTAGKLISTIAARHRDTGVDELFEILMRRRIHHADQSQRSERQTLRGSYVG